MDAIVLFTAVPGGLVAGIIVGRVADWALSVVTRVWR